MACSTIMSSLLHYGCISRLFNSTLSKGLETASAMFIFVFPFLWQTCLFQVVCGVLVVHPLRKVCSSTEGVPKKGGGGAAENDLLGLPVNSMCTTTSFFRLCESISPAFVGRPPYPDRRIREPPLYLQACGRRHSSVRRSLACCFRSWRLTPCRVDRIAD